MPNLLQVKLYGCDVLKKIAEPVEEMTSELKAFIDDLIFTMYQSDGVGIAAPQVGVSKRIFVCDYQYAKTKTKSPLVCINPELLEFDGEIMSEEGCLSVPNIVEKIRRFDTIKMSYFDMNMKQHIITANDLFATILQHELDHLNGIYLVDRLSQIRRMALGFRLNRIVHKAQQMENGIVIIND